MPSNDPYIGLLEISVVEARDLPHMDFIGKPGRRCDPYTIIKFGVSEERKTTTIKQNQNPVWKENFRILVTASSKRYDLVFEVFDWDKLSKDDRVGSASFDISTLTPGTTENKWMSLKEGERIRGKINVQITLKHWPIVEREFWTSFAKHFDYDHSNTLSLLEVTGMLEAIESPATPEEIASFFESTDTNRDNDITFDEFIKSMQCHPDTFDQNPILKKLIPEGTFDFIWYVSSKLEDEGSSIGTIMMERGFYGKVDVEKKPGKADQIYVHKRATGKLEPEKIPEYIHISLKMMYATSSGRFGLESVKLDNLLKHLTEQQGRKMNTKKSANEITNFIKFHELNVDEIQDPLDSFKTFNEFFYRKLKKEARPIAAPNDPNVAVSPADCRLHVFKTVDEATKIWIKGSNFTLRSLFKNDALADRFIGGHLVIARLAPQDYHRFHIPVDCKIVSREDITGRYYTVNPIAINNDVDVYTENRRTISVLDSPQFGEVVYIAVGATLVGSIQFTVPVGKTLKKGEEYGYFAFGGSTCLVFFKNGSINFDDDLIANSQKPIETLVAMGNSLGKSTLTSQKK